LQHIIVGLPFHVRQGLVDVRLFFGNAAPLYNALVDSGILGIVLVFGLQISVFSV
jgi:hypothetical protein